MSTLKEKLLQLHPRAFFLDTWKQMDEEAEALRAERRAEGKGYDWRPLLAFGFGAVFLILMEYLGMPTTFRKIADAMAERDGAAETFWTTLHLSEWRELYHHGWWAGWRVLGFFLLPLVIIKLSGERIRDQGLSTKGFLEHAWIYVLFFGIVFVCVVGVSFSEEFTSYYPFYRRSGRSWFDFISWELMYAAQFFSLEFFFRGWWLKAGKAMMGSHAIIAMTVPYVMIHFGKPMAETFGAIFAGVVLGTLAMKTRSIWSGFLIHVSVAISMDLASMIQNDRVPTVWFPEFLP